MEGWLWLVREAGGSSRTREILTDESFVERLVDGRVRWAFRHFS
jgi:hypothetical protein